MWYTYNYIFICIYICIYIFFYESLLCIGFIHHIHNILFVLYWGNYIYIASFYHHSINILYVYQFLSIFTFISYSHLCQLPLTNLYFFVYYFYFLSTFVRLQIISKKILIRKITIFFVHM